MAESSSNQTKPALLALTSTASSLQCKNLYEYLKTTSQELLERLYNHPAISLAVYRELPELARHYVIRLLFVEQVIPQGVIDSWRSPKFAKEHTQASKVLTELRVWHEASCKGGLPGWILSATFQKNLKIALLGGGKPWSMSSQLETDNKPRDISFLDSYAMERWECVLHYMVGSQQQEGISAEAVRVLLHAGLMKRDDDGSPVITRQGFQFLLLGTQAQVWHFILEYLDTVESQGLDLAECLAFLFQLSFSTLGKDYSTEGMSKNLLVFLQHLREFGLVYQRKRKAGRFYPTRLALNITSNGTDTSVASLNVENDVHKGYVIVETNYRVYAYTNSNLQVALIGLFTELMYRFPNLVVGVLSRESIRMALRGGITADQIINYLKQHSHSQMFASERDKTSTNVLPPTVVDQIKLWENERNRMTYTDGVLYSQFLSQVDFIVLRDYAQSLNVLIWHNEKTRTMVVTRTGHDDVKKFWKRYSKSGN